MQNQTAGAKPGTAAAVVDIGHKQIKQMARAAGRQATGRGITFQTVPNPGGQKITYWKLQAHSDQPLQSRTPKATFQQTKFGGKVK